MNRVEDDDLLMRLVDHASGLSPEERSDWIRGACGDDVELSARVREYVESEAEMRNFLTRPFGTNFESAIRTARQAAESPGTPHESSFEDRSFDPGELLLGRFRIERRVAEGGMGVVYEARDERLDRRVAVKCAKTGFDSRLPPEVRHAREISHPNVCRIFDIHTAHTAEGEVDFLTMEFLEGQTLADRLRAGPLSTTAARAIANQLCEGLAEAHRRHVVHGDLKSNNVILVPGTAETPERAVITDFGLARRPGFAGDSRDSAQMASAPVGGALASMAPELLEGARPGTASDVYALGVMIRELVSLSRGTESGIRIPRRWNAAIIRCLHPDPARRFADGEALRKALHPPLTRRWVLSAVAAAVIAASVSGAVTFQKTTAPRLRVRLALLPFQSSPKSADSAAWLSRDTAAQLSQIHGNSTTSFGFIQDKNPAARPVSSLEMARKALAADYVLQGTLETRGAGTQDESDVLRVSLTETRSGVNRSEWAAQYRPAELRYAPLALAGVVTNSFHLPRFVTKGRAAGPGVNAAARQDYLSGITYVENNIQPSDAVRHMERAVSADPDSALGYAGLAEAQAFQGRVSGDRVWSEKAEESVRQAELRDPDLPEVHLISGWIQKTLGHYEAAEAHFVRALELQPGNPDAWRRLGQTYGSNGRSNEALGALKKAVELGPAGFRNHRELGLYYYRHNKFTDALAEFSIMARLAPSVEEFHNLLGLTYYQMERYSEAESELQSAIRLQDTGPSEHALGAIFWDQKRDREAAQHYLKALALGTETSSLWLSLGFYYLEQGLAGKAHDAFRRGLSASGKALAQDPRSGREHASQAYFEARLHDFDRAETDIGEALKFSLGDETIQLAVLTYELIGHRDAALRLLESSPSTVGEMDRYPGLEKLRQDPRYVKLLGSIDVPLKGEKRVWQLSNAVRTNTEASSR